VADDTRRSQEPWTLWVLLVLSGLLSLALASHHVSLRDAWRVQEMALTHWHLAGEDGP